MSWDWIALLAMIVMVTAIVGGVILLLPITRRLGALLEAMTEERRRDSPELRRTLARFGQSLEAIEDRLMLLEEKQDFTEELLSERRRRELRAGVGEEVEADDPGDSEVAARREGSIRDSRG